MIRPMTGPAIMVMPADAPAPSDHVVLSESPPLHAALSLEARVVVAGADIDHLDGDLACMAKAIHHEAANQSLKGQLALAQLIMNRVKSPLFPKTICAVVNQAGQFFHTARYHPHSSDDRWHTAVGIARIAREDAEPALVPGALLPRLLRPPLLGPPPRRSRSPRPARVLPLAAIRLSRDCQSHAARRRSSIARISSNVNAPSVRASGAAGGRAAA